MSDAPTAGALEPVDVISVIGLAFTGSTLLAVLLDQHRDIVCVGEATGPGSGPEPPESVECSCGELLAECGFWVAVSAHMERAGHPFDSSDWQTRLDAFPIGPRDRRLTRLAPRQLIDRSMRNNRVDRVRDAIVLRSPLLGRRLRHRVARAEAFIEATKVVAGSPIHADTSKDPFRAARLERLSTKRVLTVHLVRDSPGSCWSYLKHGRAAGHRVGLGQAARRWNRSVAAAARVEAACEPGQFIRVRYEDLCAQPREQMNRIHRMAGAAPITEEPRLGTGHHLLGNRMRLRGEMPIELDERWREAFDDTSLATIERRTERARRRLGYLSP